MRGLILRLRETLGKPGSPDKFLIWITGIIVVAGLFIFTSAALGLLNRDGADFGSIAFNQLFLGFGVGAIGFLVFYKLPYLFWRKYGFYFFIVALVLTALVFIDGIGFEFGGARRWIHIGPFSLQPAEILKFATVIMLAGWCANIKEDIQSWRYGLLPFGGFIGIAGLLLVLQPDHGTFLSIFASAIAIIIVAGVHWKKILLIFFAGCLALAALVAIKPYAVERIMTFLNPEADPLGASYQVRQALIAVGNGGFWGQGYGQGVQKFSYLPEPIGDSIFAVLGEEFGFIGGITIILLYGIFALRGLYLALHARDQFARLLMIGLVIMIVSQSYLNIGAILSVFPLTGVPLIFISHGGTAMALAFAEMGLILQITRYFRSAEGKTEDENIK